MHLAEGFQETRLENHEEICFSERPCSSYLMFRRWSITARYVKVADRAFMIRASHVFEVRPWMIVTQHERMSSRNMRGGIEFNETWSLIRSPVPNARTMSYTGGGGGGW
jgi:hypothetical protein